nr:MAG TPA: hypothetical protein [Caudoviricetes sp.]DAW25579.1 MAG TPA: hypothetical protein [Caudoviricetes sp.]
MEFSYWFPPGTKLISQLLPTPFYGLVIGDHMCGGVYDPHHMSPTIHEDKYKDIPIYIYKVCLPYC